MTLRQYLSVMAANSGVMVTLSDSINELITFNIVGYATVESDVLDRTVSSVTILRTPSEITLKITISDLVSGGTD